MKKNIYLLGGVSFFTDLASQMIDPLLPQLLTRMGVGIEIFARTGIEADAEQFLSSGVDGLRQVWAYQNCGLSDKEALPKQENGQQEACNVLFFIGQISLGREAESQM